MDAFFPQKFCGRGLRNHTNWQIGWNGLLPHPIFQGFGVCEHLTPGAPPGDSLHLRVSGRTDDDGELPLLLGLGNDLMDPLYKRASRVAMGNVFLLPWTIMDKDMWPDEGMKILRSEGFKTAAMALCNDSVSIADKNLHQEEKLALILGTEGSGLLDETIKQCDYTVKIPMADGVDSLNVAAAAAVAFWELA